MPQRHVCAEVAQVADLLGVTAIIVGHTITPSGRVEMKCDGRLVMADVGLSAWTMGKMGVLVCEGGQMHALHGEDDYHTV